MPFDVRNPEIESLSKHTGTIMATVKADTPLSGVTKELDSLAGGCISRAIEMDKFSAKQGETLTFPCPNGLSAGKLVLIGLGEEALSAKDAKNIGGKAAVTLGKVGDEGASILLEALPDADSASQFALGLDLRRYAFQSYKSSVDPKAELGNGQITLLHSSSDLKEKLSETDALREGVFFTRDLVHEPANVLYPESFAARLEELSSLGLEIEVLEDEDLEALGMGALLSVGKGSEHGCRLVVMKWMGAADPNDAPFCAVGKGVTFDTGGISIKPSAGMEEMTMDMGGAGVVSGLMKTIAMRKAKANVIGLVGLVENMPDGKASRPGDIVTAMNGTTIEIINTDAEGRLVLADVLHYAITKYKPAATVNLATLTGAMIIALGHSKAGLFSNNDDLANQLLAAADNEGEGLWRMPLSKEYDELIKSPLADIKNVGGRAAGSITAAQFLQRFVGEGAWAHLDIAGVALSKEAKPTYPKGASGWGVATLNRYIADQFER